jgi:hypothetical protein
MAIPVAASAGLKSVGTAGMAAIVVNDRELDQALVPAVLAALTRQ